MPSLFVVIIVGILLAYIGYLQLQLYINRRITNAFQDVAVVVPPTKKAEPSSAMLNLTLFLMCVAVFYMMIR